MTPITARKQKGFDEIISRFDQQKFVTVSIRTVKLNDLLKDVISERYVLCKEQRKKVWNVEQMTSYVLSCISERSFINSNINNNIIIVKKNTGGQAVIVDGQGRISSLICFFSCSTVKTKFDNYSIAELLRIAKQRAEGFKLLNIKESDYNYKLKIPKGRTSDLDRYTLNNATAKDLPAELQMRALEQDFNITEVTTTVEEFDDVVKAVFIIVNSGVPLTAAQIRRGLYVDTDYYTSKLDLADRIKELIPLNDKHETKLIDVLIDFDMIISRQYKISHKTRDKFVQENSKDSQFIKKSKEYVLQIMNFSCDIFPNSKCFTEFIRDKNQWDATVKSAVILPWLIAIFELLFDNNSKSLANIDITQYKDRILNNWKRVNLATGRGITQFENENWQKLKVDHSNNKNKLRARIDIIKDIIIDSIESK